MYWNECDLQRFNICLTAKSSVYQGRETGEGGDDILKSLFCTFLLLLLMLTNGQSMPVLDQRGAETPASHPSALFPGYCLHRGRGHILAGSTVTRKPHSPDTCKLPLQLSHMRSPSAPQHLLFLSPFSVSVLLIFCHYLSTNLPLASFSE